MRKNIFSSLNKSSGEISKNLLILIGIIIVTVVAIFAIINLTKKPPPPPPPTPKEPEPVYATTVGNINFSLKEAKDLGNELLGSESKYSKTQKDVTTTEKFIELTISAENIGKENTAYGDWDVLELTDSEGRKFSYSRSWDPWISSESKCGDLLKPGFTPTLCTKIYEVAKISTGLKVKITSKIGKTGQQEENFIDLKFQ